MPRQATANLISNAVRYTPAPGKITVKVRKGDIMASISRERYGHRPFARGMQDGLQPILACRGEPSCQSGGLGGLAVVKEIVDRHGGWIQVEGKKGEGEPASPSIFPVRFRAYQGAEGKRAERQGAESQAERPQVVCEPRLSAA
ncbi:MAG: ATP-binding protein [Slackia sp.]